MTDKEFDDLKERVTAIANKWRDILNLNGHRLRYKYIRENHADGCTVAECTPLWQYMRHTIKFYMPTIVECDSEEMEEDILHEMVHILVAPAVGNDAPTNEHQREKAEFATQSITYGLLWAYAAGQEDKHGQKEIGISGKSEGPR